MSGCESEEFPIVSVEATVDGRKQILDIAHITFLAMIDTFINKIGAAFSKGEMTRVAMKTAENFGTVVFDTWEDFLQAVEDLQSPIAQIEGRAKYLGNRMFALPQCPFAPSIGNYNEVFQGLPKAYKEVTSAFNKPNPLADKYHIGHGAGVSPFCAIHQTLRSALRIKIGDKDLGVYQLGCKSGSGVKGFADDWIEAGGFSRQAVDAALDDHMCCYGIVLE